MEVLAGVLVAKLIGTVLLVLILMLGSPARIETITKFTVADLALARLYGMALIALLVGYAWGLMEVGQGRYPDGVVLVGLVSNGGAVLVMLWTGYARRSPAALVFFGAIAVGLAVAALIQAS